MKIIIQVIYLFSMFVSSIYGQDRDEVMRMLENPQPYLNAIRDGIRSGDTSSESERKLSDQIRGLAYSINQEIISAESKDWLNPSLDRKKIIKKWGAVLEPYNKELISFAIEGRSTREDSSTQARSILDFASPTEQFEQNVRSYINESSPTNASVAAYLLYEHRLLTNSDIDALRNIISSLDNYESKRAAQIGLSFYGANDGIDDAREVLRSAPESYTYEEVVAQYRDAITLIQNLGPAAKSLLPDLDALIRKISDSQTDNSDRRILAKLQYARDLVTGAQPMQERFAANGSGALPIKIGDLPERKSQDKISRKGAFRDQPKLPRPSDTNNISDAIVKEKPSFSWLIILGLFGLSLTLIAGWLKLRKS